MAQISIILHEYENRFEPLQRKTSMTFRLINFSNNHLFCGEKLSVNISAFSLQKFKSLGSHFLCLLNPFFTLSELLNFSSKFSKFLVSDAHWAFCELLFLFLSLTDLILKIVDLLIQVERNILDFILSVI